MEFQLIHNKFDFRRADEQIKFYLRYNYETTEKREKIFVAICQSILGLFFFFLVQQRSGEQILFYLVAGDDNDEEKEVDFYFCTYSIDK